MVDVKKEKLMRGGVEVRCPYCIACPYFDERYCVVVLPGAVEKNDF